MSGKNDDALRTQKAFENLAKIFSDRQMINSANDIRELQKLRLSTADNSVLKNKFSTFLQNVHNEYVKGDRYRDECIIFIDRLLANAIIADHIKFHNTISDSILSMQERTRARSMTHKLMSVLTQNSKMDTEQQMILLGMIYLTMVEGVYGEDVKACYVWAKLAAKEDVEYETVSKMKINDIFIHFRDNVGVTCIFDGWNRNLRNAIGHFSYIYDQTTGKMTYFDRRADWKCSFNIQDLTKLVDKLYDYDELIMIMMLELAIRDLCFATTSPWREKDYL